MVRFLYIIVARGFIRDRIMDSVHTGLGKHVRFLKKVLILTYHPVSQAIYHYLVDAFHVNVGKLLAYSPQIDNYGKPAALATGTE